MMTLLKTVAAVWLALALGLTLVGAPLFGPQSAMAQETAFGDEPVDPEEPIEVDSDELYVDEEAGTAEFLGNVVVVQGPMRLTAPRVLVIYDEDSEEVVNMEATGGVLMVNGEDAAESERAYYDLETETVLMEVDVFLLQGTSTIRGNELTIDLPTGTAQMSGRVKTLLTPKN